MCGQNNDDEDNFERYSMFLFIYSGIICMYLRFSLLFHTQQASITMSVCGIRMQSIRYLQGQRISCRGDEAAHDIRNLNRVKILHKHVAAIIYPNTILLLQTGLNFATSRVTL